MAFNYQKKNVLDYDNVKLAAQNQAAHAATKLADWTGGSYGQSVQSALDKINNREKFTYDLNADMLYSQYKDQYVNAGKLAMADAMGQAAAMTGGYGNSYAATVGNQAYQSYLQQLNNKVPELYQLAYNKYTQEGQDLENAYARYKNLYDTEYGEYQNKLNQWNSEQNRLDSLYNAALEWATNDANTDYNNAFNAYQQQVAEDQWAQQFAENQRQFNAQLAESNASRAASTSTKNANTINMENMDKYYSDFKKILDKYVNKNGTQNGAPKAWKEIEEKINAAADKGKLTYPEYAYLMDKYVGKLFK